MCDPTLKYRSFDGTCNNLKNPLIGSKETPFKRLLPPEYDDGFGKPKIKASSGKKLPNPRLLSTLVNTDTLNLQEFFWSHLWIMFGQFLAHDLTATAFTNSKLT
jgi:peroxidase